MAKRAEIETAIYDDPDFLALPGPARSVYVWSFTNQRTGQSGLYKVAPEQVAMETGFAGRQLETALGVLQDRRFLYYDGRVMFVRTKVRRIRTRYTATVAKAIASEVESIGDHPFVRMWLSENREHPWATADVKEPENTGDSDTPSLPPSDPQLGVPELIPISSVVAVDVQLPATDKEQLPGDFPSDLLPHLDAVVPVLGEMATRHNAKAVTRYQVAQTIMARSRRPLVRAAHDCASHFDGKRVSNVVATYRNWLDNCEQLAAIEPLNGHANGNGGPPAMRRSAAKLNALMEHD